MQTAIIVAGFGGQGVLFASQILAQAGLVEGKNVTWIPSYGPEMRGGTAHVTITISDEEIGSPLVRNPDAVLALNNPSLEKYEPLVKSGGVLVYNQSLLANTVFLQRTDIQHVPTPASEIASEIGDVKMANMVGVGVLINVTRVLSLSAVKQAIQDHLSQDKDNLIPPNMMALEQGFQLITPVKV